MDKNFFSVLIISLFKFYYLLISVSFYAYIPLFFAAGGFDERKVGALFALQSFMAILTYLPSGIINDKISAKRQIIIATFIYSLFLLLLNFSTSYLHFTALFVLWGISATMIDNSTNVIYYKQSRLINNRFFFAFFAITATMAYAIGGKLGAHLTAGNDFGLLFKALFAMSLFLIFLSYFLTDTRVSSVKLSDYKDDIFSFDSLLIAANLFLFTYHWGAELTYFTLFLTKSAALSLNDVSYIYMEVGFVMSAIIFSLGIFKEKIRLKASAALLIAVAFSGGSQIAMFHIRDLDGALFNQFLHSIGDACFIYYWLNIIPETFKYEKLGGASSFVNLFTVLSVVSGSFISSVAVRAFEMPYAAFFISACLTFSIYPLALFERFKKSNRLNSIKIMEAAAK
ncbi:MAG TPA: MFS transporter [Candidatus Wallbacteria bacterium]|nr:MFS transporter [Candidatus Wallbacteria bacterium]